MKKIFYVALVVVLAVLVITPSRSLSDWREFEERVEKSFKGIKILDLKLTSGDCVIKTGKGDEVKVILEYWVRPENAFKPEFTEQGNRLRLSERWRGSSRGNVLWTITAPAGVKIDFSSASGDLEVAGNQTEVEANVASGDVTLVDCRGKFDLESASGDVTLENCQGEFEISTASGDIEADDIKGYLELSLASGGVEIDGAEAGFDISVASGDVELRGVIITEASEFSAASGDLSITLAKTSEVDLNLSTASGDIELDYNGNPPKGYFEFTVRKNRGRVRSNVAFDREETIDKWDHDYVCKSFSQDGDTPQIIIETASGDISFRK